MKFRLKYAAAAASIMMIGGVASAQDAPQKGYVTASLESNNILYVKDNAIASATPEDKIGSNNYAKVDFYRGKFSAGVQLEGYLPAQQNFPVGLDGVNLTNYYVSWTDEDFNVTAGSFYEQFGSGLLFRSWEDRTLGFNNAILGVKAGYSFRNIVNVRAMFGMPRLGMEYRKTQVRGADLQFNISELAKLNNVNLSIEGSLLSRYEQIDANVKEIGGKPNTLGWSGRVNFDWSGLSVRAEYVDAGEKYVKNFEYVLGGFEKSKRNGNAQLLELGYNWKGLGINLSARRLEWMGSSILSNETYDKTLRDSDANLLNYLPALSTQYTYLLTTLHPYSPVIGDDSKLNEISGEMGGQIDVFYNFKRNSKLGGKYGMKIHANFSTYYSILSNEQQIKAYIPRDLLYRDLSVDFEKKFTKDFKLVLLWSMQEMHTDKEPGKKTRLQNIFVADMLYKFTPKISARLELQYLTTKEDEKDWMAALAEVNFAPKWSVWVSDMYNHGSSRKHYYNVGVSYAKSRTRIAVGYGRFRGGQLCSGGVCRWINPYTGANFSITTSF